MGLEARARPIESDPQSLCVGRDLSQISFFLDSISGQSAILDDIGRIILVNREWRDFGDQNGYREGNYGIGSNYLDVCAKAVEDGEEDADYLLAGLRDVYAGRKDSFLLAYPCHSPNKNRWFQCQVRPMPPAEPSDSLLVLIQHVDITEQVEQLRDRTRALEMANDAMQQFIYVVSHDLREPLRAIVGFSNLIATRHAEQLPKEGREFLGHIEQGGERMSSLLDGLMRYVRATEVLEERQPFDMNQLLTNVCEELHGAIVKSGAQVSSDPLPVVTGHPELLRQVFKNLIENAIKYRGDDTPLIKVSSSEKDGEWTFHVEDNGIGIEPDHAKNIFKIFQRLHRREDIPGIGIGLAICRKIVEVHQGRIWVESNMDEGSRFCFTLARN